MMYWDKYNLYGWVMIQDFPHSSFKFFSKQEANNFNLDSIAENSLIGYILKVDLEYCKELHDSHSHSDYPLCPEKIEINYDMLSRYCKDIADWYDIKVCGDVDFNTKKIQESSDEFNKGLYKLLNNYIYSKSIESQRKIMN